MLCELLVLDSIENWYVGLKSDWVHRKVFISFGGLLLYMEGPYKKLTPLRIDHVYLLLKKS